MRIFKNMYMFLLMHVDLVSSVAIQGISSFSNQEHMSVVMSVVMNVFQIKQPMIVVGLKAVGRLLFIYVSVSSLFILTYT